jgi:hypothetical protein
MNLPLVLPKLALAGLLSSTHALATVTLDYTSDVGLILNVPWSAITPQDSLPTTTIGEAQASATAYRDANAQLNLFYQRSEIIESVGNPGLATGYGLSHAYSEVNTLISFAFGDTLTDLTITLNNFQQILNSSKEAPWNPINETGDFIGYIPGLGGGGTGLTLNFDNQGFYIPGGWTPGASVTFPGLTGDHVLRVQTTADEGAIANYPYFFAPDSANTTLLLGAALALLGLALPKRLTSAQIS